MMKNKVKKSSAILQVLSKIVIILLNSFIMLRIFLEGYSVRYNSLDLLTRTVIISIPIALLMVSVYFIITKREYILIILAVLCLVFIISRLPNTFSLIGNQVNYINNQLGAGREISYSDIVPLVEWIAIFFAVVGFMSMYIYPFNILIFDGVFIGFLWGVDYLGKLNKNFPYLAMLFTYLLMERRYFVKNKERVNLIEKKEYGERKVRRGIQFIALLLIGFTVIYFTSFEMKGIFYDKLYNKLSETLSPKVLTSNIKDSFDLSYVGYSDTENSLGGNVSFRQDTVLKFKVDSDSPRYLKGSTRRTYTGHSWIKSNSEYVLMPSADQKFMDYLNSSGYKDIAINIEHINMRVSSPFEPYYSIIFDMGNTNSIVKPFYSEVDNQFLTSNIITSGYSMIFRTPRSIDALSLKAFNIEGNYKEKYAIDLQMPQKDRDVVKKVLQKIGVDKNPLVTTSKIKSYLQKNFAYTLTPNDERIGDDFLNNFLNVSKQGYCVHYATAMTLLLRQAGIPARYVEGFAVSGSPDNSGAMNVLDSEAHAWTEVLVDSANDVWMVVDATGTGQEFLEEQTNQTQPQNTTTATSAANTTTALSNTQAVNQANNGASKGISKVLEVILIAILSILILLSIFYLIKLLRQRNIEKLIENPDATELISFIFKIYESSGIDFTLGDTNLEKTRYIEAKSSMLNMEKLVNENYRYKFSNRVSGKYELKELMKIKEMAVNDAFNYYRHKMGKFKHFIKRNII